jgi:hypothetical protein
MDLLFLLKRSLDISSASVGKKNPFEELRGFGCVHYSQSSVNALNPSHATLEIFRLKALALIFWVYLMVKKSYFKRLEGPQKC